MQDMEKTYNPEFEKRIYDMWMKGKFFEAHPNAEKEPFTVMMPPPNITGQLHMGHALDETIQDVIVRFKRMCGYETLWMPGTDHASIATEVKVVEKMRKEEGLSKNDVGRDGFLERAWAWKTNTAEESSSNKKHSAFHATGPNPLSQWTKIAPTPCLKRL